MVLKVAFKKHVSICSCNKKSSVFSSWCTVSIFWVVKYSGDFLFRARFYSWYFLQIMLLHNAMCLLSTVLIFWVSKIVLNLCSAFMDVCIFGVIFWKSWCCIRQCVSFHPASCIITRKLETVSIKLWQLLTVIYNWQYFPSPRKSELSELRIQDRLLTRDTGFNHCHLETRTIHWDQTIIPGRLLFSVLFLNSGRHWESVSSIGAEWPQ